MTERVKTERRFQPGIWASLATLAVFSVLVWLGVWQLERLEWKEGLIASLQERAEAPPLTSLPSGPLSEAEIDALSYRAVRLTGHFVEGAEFFLPGRSYQGMTGQELAAAFVTEEGRGVIVSRGWLPPQRLTPESRPETLTQGPVTLEGILRKGGWSGMESFRPANDPQGNVWLYYDLERMADEAGLEDPITTLYVSVKSGAAKGEPDSLPVPLPPAITLANNHLEYALTWFALAGGLIGIFLLFGFARGKDARRSEEQA